MAVTKWDPLSIDGQNLTVSATLFDSTLSNFVAYFPISVLDASLIANARGDYQDIRFYTQAGTELDREITTGGSCFVRLPSASSSVSTVLDVNSGSGVSKGNDVTCWTTANYDGVWHLDEASGTQPSSTGVGDMNPVSTNGGGATGKIGNGYEIDADTDRLAGSDESSFDYEIDEEWFYSAWVYVNSTGSNQYCINKCNNINTIQINCLCMTTAGGGIQDQRMGLFLYGGGAIKGATSTNTVSTGAWHHMVWANNTASGSAGLSLWLDGVKEINTNWQNGNPSSILSDNPVYIGGRQNSPSRMDGTIDEVRIASFLPTDDYIKAIYNNENDYSSYVTASDYTVFGGGRIITNLNPPSLGNNIFYSLVG